MYPLRLPARAGARLCSPRRALIPSFTDETERIPVDERVVITEIGADYMVVKRISTVAAEEKEKEEKIQTDDKKDL